MSDKPIFAGLFGGQQSEKAKKEYLEALKEAQRWLAASEAEAGKELASNQEETGWIN